MSYIMIAIRQIEVIGEIWQPGFGTCGTVYNLSRHHIANIRGLGGGTFTRDACRLWLRSHAGDFQHIEDFHADIEDFDSPWENPESADTFAACMG